MAAKCPSLKTLKAWVDHRCELDETDVQHVRTCHRCLQFLEQTSHAPEMEKWLQAPVAQTFHSEPEFQELQTRLHLLAQAAYDETALEADSTIENGSQFGSSPTDQPSAGGTMPEHPPWNEFDHQETELELDLESLQAGMPDQRYRLLQVLGRGGSGLVVLAFDTKLDREVAVKFLVRDSESARHRLRREGRILAELDHPNVVRIFDIGELNNTLESRGTQYLVMEYVAGGSAAKHGWGQATTFRELARMLQGVAEGLQIAHNQGLVHRDLKPSNLLLDEEKRVLKVADFGLAKHLSESATQVTRAGNLVGTPQFMSPEQVLGAMADETGVIPASETSSTDIYSLGATLYALLTGQPPLNGNTLAVLRQIPEVQPVAPSILNPAVPRSLELICQHAMEKTPARRYSSMREFADDLQRFVDGRPIHARAPSWFQKGVEWCSRNKALASTLVLFLCSLTAGVIGTTWMWLQASQNAKQSAQYADSLEVNRQRLRESVSRFQQRIFAEEAMHWQMTDAFRREMFSDVINYLDEFSELLSESSIDFGEFEQLISDYLMISKAAREVGRYDDAILAADRAVELIDQHNHLDQSQAAKMLYLEYRVASAACRARIPLLSFLAVPPTNAVSPDKEAKDARLDLKPEPWAARCTRLVQLAERELKLDEKCDVAEATDEQFKWILAKRECVFLMAADGDSASADSASADRLESARQIFDVCLHELQRGVPVTDTKRLLLVGDLGWDLAWAVTGRSGDDGHREVLERSEVLLTKLRNLSRSLEKQLITTDWLQGSTIARKAFILSQAGDLAGACEAAKLASASFDRAIEMRPQNRKWIEESVRLELLYSDWLVQRGE
ncbi:MAG: serine/threonine protein kinase, partial [Pirellulaceae bacterium]|nr:serine/threonine protein kinase [Pirellulaceae bacterium]